MARSSNFLSVFKDQNCRKICFFRLFPAASLLFLLLFMRTTWIARHDKENLLAWSLQKSISKFSSTNCEDQCSKPPGSETLPKGIIANTSNLEARPLWGSPMSSNTTKSLFAAVVGIKQKKNVDKMVQKFLGSNFVVMLFHYDGIVDEWKGFEWSHKVIHISVENQTKWWFAKRFLHPDIVVEYDYIFLWDEDLGVQNFDPQRYLSIVKREGLEISQPALEIGQSEVHHLITARGSRSKVHRRVHKHGEKGGIRCDENSSAPPCTGWIEVMAPVFSKASWRCVWYMIQNDLIHAWGLDMRLGYFVDAEYIVHYGLPTLGEPEKNKVRRQSYNEYKVFNRRWKEAGQGDECWTDPYPDDPLNQSSL
ncbi:hypothetical protein ACJIZ3_023148 [Penstemon smallii]|uniref:Lysine ketoglutarate reductase trans-splicing-like protein n=1 Tax=Penstemon smallii TaxID=265156 RepID=A0ABD3TP79_9LAMI